LVKPNEIIVTVLVEKINKYAQHVFGVHHIWTSYNCKAACQYILRCHTVTKWVFWTSKPKRIIIHITIIIIIIYHLLFWYMLRHLHMPTTNFCWFSISRLSLIVLLYVGDQQRKATMPTLKLLSHSVLKLGSNTSCWRVRNWSLLWVLYFTRYYSYAKPQQSVSTWY